MRIQIDKRLILENDMSEIDEVVPGIEDDDEISSGALLAPAALGIAGGSYAINKPKADAFVTKKYDNAAAAVKTSKDNFNQGVSKGYDNPVKQQPADRSRLEKTGHIIGKKSRLFQKRLANGAFNILNKKIHVRK